jgi:adenylate kinase family enzyme
MLSRKRKDDTEEKIENRLEWFNLEVKKAIEFFKEESYYDFFKVDGQMSIEDIHKNILKKLL